MRIPTLGTLALALIAVPALADEVHLTNGRAFEGVVATATDTHVSIRMPFGGELKLARSQVARIEKSDSTFGELLRRREELRAAPDAGAGKWLELARWALANELRHGAREAALHAAELDPELAGLAPILRGFGFTLDPDLGRWIAHDEYMRRQGFVADGGEWVTPAERAARIRAREAEQAAARERRLAALEAERMRSAPQVAVVPVAAPAALYQPGLVYASPLVYAVPAPVVVSGGIFGGFSRPPSARPRHPRGARPQPPPAPARRATRGRVQTPGTVLDGLVRQPGSLIPGVLDLRGGAKAP